MRGCNDDAQQKKLRSILKFRSAAVESFSRTKGETPRPRWGSGRIYCRNTFTFDITDAPPAQLRKSIDALTVVVSLQLAFEIGKHDSKVVEEAAQLTRE